MVKQGILVGFLAVAVVSILIAGCLQGNGSSNTSSNTGRAVFTLSDAAADMGAVTSVKVTIDRVEAHSTTAGWTTVSSDVRTYDLLQLKANNEQVLLADAQIGEGAYSQVRLEISKVVVTDAQGTHDARLPSSDLKIVGMLVVNTNTTSTVSFDFIADESLHMTGNGVYIMTPVIQLETRERAEVDAGDERHVRFTGGVVNANAKVGMDIYGVVAGNGIVPANTNLTIESDGEIRSHGILSNVAGIRGDGRVVVAIADPVLNMGAVTSVNVTIDRVEAYNTTAGWMLLSTRSRTFDLLELNATNRVALLADARLGVGAYDQVRLSISQVTVTDSNGTHDAKLPSNELKLVGQLVVNENETSTVVVDFSANESLHLTGNGRYILSPVVHLQTREKVRAEIYGNNNVRITGGSVRTSVRFGMDVDGNVGENYMIPGNTNLTIESNGRVLSHGVMNRLNIGIGADLN